MSYRGGLVIKADNVEDALKKVHAEGYTHHDRGQPYTVFDLQEMTEDTHRFLGDE